MARIRQQDVIDDKNDYEESFLEKFIPGQREYIKPSAHCRRHDALARLCRTGVCCAVSLIDGNWHITQNKFYKRKNSSKELVAVKHIKLVMDYYKLLANGKGASLGHDAMFEKICTSSKIFGQYKGSLRTDKEHLTKMTNIVIKNITKSEQINTIASTADKLLKRDCLS